MTREIKFRAWTKWNRKMRHDIERIEFGNSPEFNGSPIFVGFDEPDNGQGMSTGIELMQWTGLKDKNGEDIYEGDIVCLVSQKKCKSQNRVVKYGSVGQGYGFNVSANTPRGYKIIGNIYDNPELLS